MRRIFLSHSSHDNQFCRKLAANLTQYRFQVWYDEYELHEGLIASLISSAIEEHDAFVCVITQHALKSRWVELEYNAAVARNSKRLMDIFPIVADDSTPPAILQAFKCFDFFSMTYANALQTLVRALGYEDGAAALSGYIGENDTQRLRDSQSLDVPQRIQLLRDIQHTTSRLTPGQMIDLEQIMFGDPVRAVRKEAARTISYFQR